MAKIATPKKQKKESIDFKYLGKEIIIGKDNLDADQYDLAKAMNWYSYFYEVSKAQKILKNFVKKHKDFNVYKDVVGKMSEDRTPKTAAWLCQIIENGCPPQLEKRSLDYIRKSLGEVRRVYEDMDDGKVKKSVHQLTLEKASEYIGFLEEDIDRFINSGFSKKENLYSKITEMNMAGKYYTILETHFKRIYKELEQAYKDTRKNVESDFSEAYSNYTLEELKALTDFHKEILDNLNLIKVNEKRARQTKKKKKSSKKQDKLKFFKNLEHSDEYKLTSEPSNRIIGAKKVLTFDTKTKTLSLYVAEDEKEGLDIYRTAIKGFSDKFSGNKRIGSRRNALENCNKANKNSIEKIFQNIPRKINKCNGRVNERTLIVKIFN